MHPILLWGLLAAAVPVLIHLLMRPRPRRLRFPALPLLHAALARGQRANRIENFVLMLIRAALLCLAALLLAAPTCAPKSASPLDGPRATVLLIDDSISTTARVRFDDPLSTGQQLRAAAHEQLDALAHDSAESQVAVLRTGDPQGGAVLTAVQAELRRRLRGRPPAEHAQPLGAALATAARVLAAAPQPQRELLIYTDGTHAAWRDVRPVTLRQVENLRVQVITPAEQPRANFGILSVTAPQRVWPTSTWVPLHATVHATGSAADCWLVVRRGEQVLQRVGPLRLEAEKAVSASLQLPPGSPGPYAANVTLEPADLFDADQRRYVAWQIVARPVVWLVAPQGGPEASLTQRLLKNLLAPATLAEDQQRLTLVTHTSASLENAAGDRDTTTRPALIVLLPTPGLPEAAQDLLERHLLDGTTVLLVPTAEDPTPTWPGLRRYLSENYATIETVAPPVTLQPPPVNDEQPGAAALREMATSAIRERLRFEPLLDAVTAPARYTDDVPAILQRSVGRGELLALTTTPDPAWSDLGIRAAGLLAWLHGTLHAALGPPQAVASFQVNEAVNRGFGALPGDTLAHATRDQAPEDTGAWVRIRDRRAADNWPTAKPGTYAVSTGRGPTRARYAVNWPTVELDRTAHDPDDVLARLGVESAVFRTTAEPRDAGTAGWLPDSWAWANLSFVLGLGLLALFVSEMLLAGRAARI